MGISRWVVGVLALTGCELIANIPASTQQGIDDATPIDDGPGADTPDDSGGDCTQVCPLDRPVCTNNACTGCTIDEQCPSLVCLLDGACADPSRVVYASPAGSGTTCSLATPCTSDSAATQLASPSIDVLKLLPGTYVPDKAITINTTATIAATGAVIQGTAFYYAVDVTAGGNATVIGLEIVAAPGNENRGFYCTNGALTLHRVSATRSVVGVYGNGCAVEIRRSKFSQPTAYAAFFAGGQVRIESTFFVRSSGPDIAALGMADVTSGSIEHVTIANNASPGLACTNSSNVTLRNLIVSGNATTAGAGCALNYSLVGADYLGGVNNTTGDPQFVAPGSDDFHLGVASPARELADPTTLPTIDFDGEPRPQPAGTRHDSGADERP